MQNATKSQELPCFEEDLFKPLEWNRRSEFFALFEHDKHGDMEELVLDDVFASIFSMLPYHMITTMRLVCRRFRDIVDRPRYALRCATCKYSTSHFKLVGHPMEFTKKPLLSMEGNVWRPAFELTYETNTFQYFCINFVESGDSDNNRVLKLKFVKDYNESLPYLLEAIRKHPHWFTRAVIAGFDCMPQLREPNTWVKIEADMNISRVEHDLISNPGESYEDFEKIAIPFFYTARLSEFRQGDAVTSNALKVFLQEEQRPNLPLETEPAFIAPERKSLLTDAQRRLVAWLQEMERRVLHDEPLAQIPLTLQNKALSGTSMAFDLKGTLCLDRHSIRHAALDGRGVIVASGPGLGKTRALSEFLLESFPELSHLAHLKCDPAADWSRTLPRDALTFTEAVDFGYLNHDILHKKKLKLVHTQASLVIASNTTVNTWYREVKELFPHRKIITIMSKTDHQNLTYADIARADLVIVTVQFLGQDYYKLLRWPSIRNPADESMRGRQPGPAIRELAIQRLLEFSHTEVEFNTKAPLLEWFAWSRMVIDEIHTYLHGSQLLQRSDFMAFGLPFFSARFVVGVSATLLDSSRSRYAEPRYSIESTRLTTLRNEILSMWMRNVLRFQSKFDREGLKDDLAESLCVEGYYDVRPSYLKTVPGLSSASWSPIGWGLFSYGWPNSVNSAYIRYSVLLRAIQALVWRDTPTNTERECDLPPAKIVNWDVVYHPAVEGLHKLLKTIGGDASLIRDFPVSFSMLMHNTTASKLVMERSYAKIWEDLQSYVDAYLKKLEDVKEVAMIITDGELNGYEIRELKSRRQKLIKWTDEYAPIPETLEWLVHACNVSMSGDIDPVEREFGSRARLLMHIINTLFTRYPDASVIVATRHRQAMVKLFRAHSKRPFKVLGGLNGRVSLCNERSFVNGDVKLLILDSSQAAHGINLQMGNYLIDYDHDHNYGNTVQLYGRVIRPGAKQSPVIIRLN